MVRIQIQLDRAQHRRVRQRARRLGVSVSEVIRRSLDAAMQQEPGDDPAARARRALAVAGKYSEAGRGARRTAANHDAALAEAFKS
jgi:hypothetical protein